MGEPEGDPGDRTGGAVRDDPLLLGKPLKAEPEKSPSPTLPTHSELTPAPPLPLPAPAGMCEHFYYP